MGDKVKRINKEVKKKHERFESQLKQHDRQIEGLIKKDWFDKIGLACTLFGVILSVIALFVTVKLYKLGEDYTLSMNNVKYNLSAQQIPKIGDVKDGMYFTMTPYTCYPMKKLSNNSGSITEAFLFKLNDGENIEVIKVDISKNPIPEELNVHFVENEKNNDLKNFSAYIQNKNKDGNYEGKNSIYKTTDGFEKRLYLYDPAFSSHLQGEYVGLYAMALRGKNDNFQVIIFGTKLATSIREKDKTEVFYDIDVYDEKKWDKSFLSRKDAVLLYEKTINFLDSKLPY